MLYLQLESWEEIMGIFEHIEKHQMNVIVVISGRELHYCVESVQGKFLMKELTYEKLGKRVTILNTDSSVHPLVIQWPNESMSEKEPSRFFQRFSQYYGVEMV